MEATDHVEEGLTESPDKKKPDSEDQLSDMNDSVSVAPEAHRSRISHFLNHDSHSALIRFGYPVFLLFTLGLLVASDIGSGMVAKYTIKDEFSIRGLDSTDIYPEPDYTVTIFNSMKESWEAGAYGTAIIIFVLSIIWPYVKLLFLAIFWFYPFSPLNTSYFRMEMMIAIVEHFGKWSLTDIFLFIMFFVGFDKISIATGTIFIPDGVNVNGTITSTYSGTREPKWGMSMFSISSILALFASHYLLCVHRRVVFEDRDQTKNTSTQSDISKKTLAERSGVPRRSVGLLLIIYVALTVSGFIVKIITFHFLPPDVEAIPLTESYEGIGDLTAYFNNVTASHRSLSMASLGHVFVESASKPDSFNVRFVQIVYYVMIIVSPIANVFCYATLWFVPLSKETQKKMFHWGEFAHAWNAYTVMTLAVLVASYQIPSFNEEIIEEMNNAVHISETTILSTYAIPTIAW
eukprot:CAMPEP_0197827078 /NCGR_PEP_ID=MMETSP1437-20131217/3946_1 /TAXON_ID=49252 ORGANISM="Eucampia antarctica, Strain CCMP1452" /NCGR_SAMPLE_ID=MMETSP1437 /ASSEMBLY_ACC=CAM_ASM_001096 /LENGTH=461 /DNA_ID=CAMNT_0043427801 /DNA_START=18 /DNA_END=1400 /DNA_ORIENTATION=+